jgi:hypothetical protein
LACRDGTGAASIALIVLSGVLYMAGVLLYLQALQTEKASVLRANTAALLSINASNELINIGGGLGNRYALMFAPLSLVQAIGSTMPLRWSPAAWRW